MNQKLSQTKRAIEAREWRVGYREKRRFNSLLNRYISVKYNTIYNEYREFYRSLNQAHPERGDLTKTKTFKHWKKLQQSEQESTCESPESDEDNNCSNNPSQQPPVADQTWKKLQQLEQESTCESPESDKDNNCSNNPSQQPPVADQTVSGFAPEDHEPLDVSPPQQDILAVAAEEIFPANPVNANDVENIIAEIINDLQQDDAIRDILLNNDDEMVVPHYTEEDEGIGLNVEVELEDIIEPLDLEAKGFDFS